MYMYIDIYVYTQGIFKGQFAWRFAWAGCQEQQVASTWQAGGFSRTTRRQQAGSKKRSHHSRSLKSIGQPLTYPGSTLKASRVV